MNCSKSCIKIFQDHLGRIIVIPAGFGCESPHFQCEGCKTPPNIWGTSNRNEDRRALGRRAYEWAMIKMGFHPDESVIVVRRIPRGDCDFSLFEREEALKRKLRGLGFKF
jgi:hypothetical protein